MTLRRATRVDDGELGRVHSQAWRETYRGIISDDYLEYLTPERSTVIFAHRAPANTFVLEEEHRIAGFAVVGHSRETNTAPRTGELCGLYVLKAFQGRGGGQQLLDASLTRLKLVGYRHCILWVLAENQNARGFYEKNGFLPDGAVQYPNLGGLVTEIRMQKEL